ncbi:flagellar hook-basal body complex protein FliE [Siccirubricoccus sp. KC 17139]|uniref:Flagellar hook-basal body complex protein FliE n=1 Tax=Siccirubricoccus soli TaxID=2899147 RepID=A0ABT1DD87_9PROT|nr:flagellar hook-basal body complex protein FliE [Siccirubricoccus soli]MCO6419907.1 flagellar hook-basal body complex protein FliE [Siccirubricoccus soli]MCP2686042.1 flagellar hook-basal body complex protein FliE [Siccirubricoccus soli]
MPGPVAPSAVAPAQAAAAYRAAASPAEAGAAAEGFGAALQRAVQDAVEVGRGADAATTQSLMGQGSVTDVVLAVSRAELTLQTAVAVRDRVVSAYQDVMRMPI